MRANYNDISIDRIVSRLSGKRVLLITTSTRWEGSDDLAKSTHLANEISKRLYDDSTDSTLCKVIDASKLHIYQCEGNVSTSEGNSCGVKDSVLKDSEKNPTGCHRCWASINHKDDELWKISKELLDCDVVIFFGSVRWGAANAVYQKLIERLNWLENRWTTLEEDNIISHIEAGVIFVGHNWNAANVVEHQKQVLNFYGFQVPSDLSAHWQWTSDSSDESAEGYVEDPKSFERKFGFAKILENFKAWISK